MTLRRAGQMHHLGIGTAHARKRVLAIADDHHVTVTDLTTGEILSVHLIQPDKTWSEQQPVHLPLLSDPSLSFEGWSWSPGGKKLAGIRHLPNGVHSGIGIYDRESKNYEWLTDFGDWPVWFNDSRRLLFVSQGKIFLFDTGTRKYQPVLTVTDQDVDIGSPALSPNNRVIYFTFVAAEADIWLMTLE